VAQRYGLPRVLIDEGVRGYGFHGLSYEYIAGELSRFDPKAALGRTVVAHLGSGASLCALVGGRSVACTLGFSALDGLLMGTRPGRLDPGILLYLMQTKGMDAAAIERLLYQESGLLGVSGISNDMRDLLASAEPSAKQALELFVYRAATELGSMVAAAGGLDALVFTAGIGEHDAFTRAGICERSAWLGIVLDESANQNHGPRISGEDSAVGVWVIPTNEELMIARHTRGVISGGR
jgi:acetate kinase